MTEVVTEPVIRRIDVIVAPVETPTVARSRNRRAKQLLVSFLTVIVALNLGFGLLLDFGPPHLRDPEYGFRLTSLRRRVRENPDRSLTVVIGSSRTAMGIRPDALEDQTGPLYFNLSLAGAGPVTQLMLLRRLEHEGITPAKVILEYWPPFFRGDGAYSEEARLNPTRFLPCDRKTIEEFFANPAQTLGRRQESRWLPFLVHRKPLMDRYLPGWLPHTERADAMFAHLDGWGWLPGRESSTAIEREKGFPHVYSYYWPLYCYYQIGAVPDRALRACITHCRERNIDVVLLYLPESERFQTLKTSESTRLAEAHLAAVRQETGVPFLDARGWITDDESLPDGFHLTRSAAALFTRQVANELAQPGKPCRK